MLAASCGAHSPSPRDIDCRGRFLIPITQEQADHEPRETLAPKVAHNENYERECGGKPLNWTKRQ